MRQLLLDLGAAKPPTLDSFVAGQNGELLDLLARFAQRDGGAPGDRIAYVWGESGAGKTHLLRALAAGERSRYIAPDGPDNDFRYSPATSLYLVDDCERLSAERQVTVFNLYNQVRDQGGWLVAAGPLPPSRMALREDLRTRLGWGLIYQVHGLTDEDKIAALGRTAAARGLTLSPGVLPYLITHFRRDMQSLSAMLDALDKYSLETQRPITLPLLREVLQLDSDTRQ
ncbi:DnaA regulatory inactivator Hda [Noviherbaspirillum galbum]|uniref:DnaA regulatory inactivator Hda n=1 Tax=Noviherbaspirillum galbum TaxID=2709383 RepID=A0A6B3SIR3_9BURK|nr:DnaA regulatory inactivator Hda [Noviherbaspirillum galbum]NEX60707.1 DnaA regulatory inactivator Hda [Noviherbaspirillum galbum]